MVLPEEKRSFSSFSRMNPSRSFLSLSLFKMRLYGIDPTLMSTNHIFTYSWKICIILSIIIAFYASRSQIHIDRHTLRVFIPLIQSCTCEATNKEKSFSSIGFAYFIIQNGFAWYRYNTEHILWSQTILKEKKWPEISDNVLAQVTHSKSLNFCDVLNGNAHI